MILTNLGIEKMGFKRLEEGERIEAIFRSIHIYKISGVKLDGLKSLLFHLTVYESPVQLSVGSDLNAMCRELVGEDFVDNLDEWERNKRSSPPYLVIMFGPTKNCSAVNCYHQRKDGILLTYNSFEQAKSGLKDISSKVLPSILTSLACEFSDPEHRADFEPIANFISGITSEGEKIEDICVDISASVTIQTSLCEKNLREKIERSAKLAERIIPRAAELFELGMQETDHLKAFLFFYLTIEISTHRNFKSIEHTARLESFIQPEPRIAESSLALFKIRNEYMKNIQDRFIWCAINIWDEITDSDVEEFKALKKIRDDVGHGARVSISREDVERVRTLAKRICQMSI